MGFVDADDEIHPDMYKTLVELMLKTNADIVCCSHNTCYETGFLPPATLSGKTALLTPEEFAANLFLVGGHPEISGFYWDKVYKAALFETMRFDEGYSLTLDTKMMIELLYKVSRIATIDKPLYDYWQYDTSLSHTVIPDIELFESYLAAERYLYERLDREEYRALRANKVVFGYIVLVMRCYNYFDRTGRAAQLARLNDRLASIYTKDRDVLSAKNRGFMLLSLRLPWLCGIVCLFIYKVVRKIMKKNAKIRRSLMPYRLIRRDEASVRP